MSNFSKLCVQCKVKPIRIVVDKNSKSKKTLFIDDAENNTDESFIYSFPSYYHEDGLCDRCVYENNKKESTPPKNDYVFCPTNSY